ncbi:FAD binding domain-containing protein [Xylaria intraflava]|nr:FAD binding domain-containing protein [Xylaria intraflava]
MGGATECITVDYLIVGAGPAGAGLASFMAQNGLKGLVIARTPGTADSPRAHLVNPFALETLRDIGLDKDGMDHATRGEMFQSFRWARSMLGEEYGKVQTWGSSPKAKGELARASPCEYLDLPQSHLEPILVRYASTSGFQFRFSTQLIGIDALPGGESMCVVRDLISHTEYRIRAKYVFGADGAHSKVAEVTGIKFQEKPQAGVACNIIFTADIGHLMTPERFAGLHVFIQPDNFIGMAPVMRLVRPWKKWMLVCTFAPEHNRFRDMTIQSPELIDLIHKCIGDDSIKVEIQKIDPWNVLDATAERYSVSGRNAFILGDAAHRHPPPHGNGSNTCLQDAYNLAWKVAYVAKGLAGPKLLETYSAERQPVGETIVREANIAMDGHMKVWTALGGVTYKTAEEGMRIIGELSEVSPAGDERRRLLHEALESKQQEGNNLGLCMNQWYESSAIYLADEKGPRPVLEGDPVVEILISTYPGNRLPHAWVDLAKRQKLTSTQDLAGQCAFSLFTGHGGQAWKKAAANITKATGIPINAYGIGMNLDYIDVYRDWYKIREVAEDGCVLVRPDRFVAWRSKTMISDCEGKLHQVLNSILSRDGLSSASYRTST